MPTFKGIIRYLSNYILEIPDIHLIKSYPEIDEKTAKEIKNKANQEKRDFQNAIDNLRETLMRNGKLLNYPLFENTNLLSVKSHLIFCIKQQ
jgi:hypothetical protein